MSDTAEEQDVPVVGQVLLVPYAQTDLAHFLPPEPETSVTHARHAGHVVRTLAGELTATITDLEVARHDAVAAIVTAALDNDPEALSAAVDSAGDRTAAGTVDGLRAKVEALNAAGENLWRKELAAQRQDPDHLAWQAACQRITEDWRNARGAGADIDDPDGRADAQRRALTAFAIVHAT